MGDTAPLTRNDPMPNTPPTLLHIGLPKTGTTSLQKLVFERHAGLRYFGQTNLWEDDAAKAVLRALMLPDEPADAARAAISGDTENSATPLVISDEALSLGEFMLRATRWPLVSDPEAIARRARHLLGDATVLIVLRNQADWLESWHRQGLKTGKYTETDFGQWIDLDLADRAERLMDLLDYERLCKAWIEVFGREQVHIRFFEHDRDRFADLAADALSPLGIAPETVRPLLADEAWNVTGSGFRGLPPGLQRFVRTPVGRAVTKLVPRAGIRSLRSALQKDRAFEPVDPAWRAEIRSRFAPGNARLFDALGIDNPPPGYL